MMDSRSVVASATKGIVGKLAEEYEVEDVKYDAGTQTITWTLKSRKTKPTDPFGEALWKAALSSARLAHSTAELREGKRLLLLAGDATVAASPTTLRSAGAQADGFDRATLKARASDVAVRKFHKAIHD